MSTPSLSPPPSHPPGSHPGHNKGNGSSPNNSTNGGPSSSSSPSGGRPSDRRRKALNEDLTVPLVSNFFPLERYYDAADKVYESCLQLVREIEQLNVDNPANKSLLYNKPMEIQLNEAYVYGKRYCLFCLDAIPAHNYYGTSKYMNDHIRHTKQVATVVTALEKLATYMDRQETFKQRRAQEIAAQEAAERERQQQAKFEQFQKQMEQQKKKNAALSGNGLEVSALTKLQLLLPPGSSVLPISDAATSSRRIPRDPSGDEKDIGAIGKPSSRYRLVETDDEDDGAGALPPPLPPPIPPGGSAAPPPYYQAVGSQRPVSTLAPTTTSSTSFAISGSRVTPDPGLSSLTSYTDNQLSIDQAPPLRRKPSRKSKPLLPMLQLQDKYKDDYIRAQHARKILVSGIDTYQGRNSESTNGCTVISAMIAATHLSAPSVEGISDAQIVQIIDRQCGPVLRQIRSKLGLGGHALIIPSDVHDHLVDAKQLRQEDFVGAAGGNIMDPTHLSEFIKLLQFGHEGETGNGTNNSKAAATLFFREHVISIVKIPIGHNKAYYDLIDSLPNVQQGGRSMASRTRCMDVESLQTLLYWYASRKFSASNCSYIDTNPWDDGMADLDPRVFQGFAWATRKQ